MKKIEDSRPRTPPKTRNALEGKGKVAKKRTRR